jgi:hypothetical protein
VITPYKAQQSLIADLIYEDDKVKIASVESFQGDERDFMIMSCVRSTGIGFLDDPRRLNVSLTRARCGLIMIGNAKHLVRDPMWKALLRHMWVSNALVCPRDVGIEVTVRPRRRNLATTDRSDLRAAARFSQISDEKMDMISNRQIGIAESGSGDFGMQSYDAQPARQVQVPQSANWPFPQIGGFPDESTVRRSLSEPHAITGDQQIGSILHGYNSVAIDAYHQQSAAQARADQHTNRDLLRNRVSPYQNANNNPVCGFMGCFIILFWVLFRCDPVQTAQTARVNSCPSESSHSEGKYRC